MTEAAEKYEIAPHTTDNAQVSMFLNEQRFEFAQRIGKMLASSTMIPDHYRNNIGNCLIALNLSERLKLDVFGLMQTSYIVHGRPGFEAKLLLALFNAQTKLFVPPLRWEMKGDFPKGKDAACRAYATDKETGELLYGEWIDWEMIKGEGWDSKTGSKWNTIPGQMFRYRSASFFINAYEPGLKLGIMTTDELEDMAPINVTPSRPTLSLIPEGETTGADPYEVKESPVPPQNQAQETTTTKPAGEDKQEQEKAPQESKPENPKPEKKAKGNGKPLQPEKENDEPDNETKAFLSDAMNYYESLPETEWKKLLDAFQVDDPVKIKAPMRAAFLRTAKSRLDKANAQK